MALNRQLAKLNKYKLAEFNEKSAALSSEIELKQRKDRELADSLTEKNKRFGSNSKDYKKIEVEHITLIEILKNKKVKLIGELDDKKEELKVMAEAVNKLTNIKQELTTKTPQLERQINRLKENVGNTTIKLNNGKKELDVILGGLKEQVKTKQEELIDTDDKLEKSKEELKSNNEMILEENRLLGIRRKDLEIYESRIRKANPKIIL